jgi:predicted component of viral defense system (DUF524 family)
MRFAKIYTAYRVTHVAHMSCAYQVLRKSNGFKKRLHSNQKINVALKLFFDGLPKQIRQSNEYVTPS